MLGGGIGGNSGSINLSGFTGNGGDGSGGNGGSITLMGGFDSAHAGSINLNGGSGGSDNHGGSIISTGDNENRGGTLDMSAGYERDGGSISTLGGGAINTSERGGSINTSNEGGSIDTRVKGSIQLGYNNQRTTLNGSASGANRTITLPNADGTLALESFARDTAIDALYEYAGVDTGYIITNIKFRQTLSNPIWQPQTSPVTAEFNRDATTAKNNPLASFTKVFPGGYSMFWRGSELGVGYPPDSEGTGAEPMLIVSHARLVAELERNINVQNSGRTIFATYTGTGFGGVWTATDYNDYYPLPQYTYCEVTWIKTTAKTNFTTGRLVLGNTDRTTTIQASSTATRTITLPNATGTIALQNSFTIAVPNVDIGKTASSSPLGWSQQVTIPTNIAELTGGLPCILDSVAIRITNRLGTGQLHTSTTYVGGLRVGSQSGLALTTVNGVGSYGADDYFTTTITGTRPWVGGYTKAYTSGGTFGRSLYNGGAIFLNNAVNGGTFRTAYWETPLTEAMDATQTTLLQNYYTSGAPSYEGSYLKIDDEVVLITSWPSANGARPSILRAQLGTTATTHAVASSTLGSGAGATITTNLGSALGGGILATVYLNFIRVG